LTSAAGDTLAVERVTRSQAVLRSEVFVPNQARLEVVGTLDGRGCPTAVEVRVYPWLSAPGSTPVRQVEVRLAGDSVHVAVAAGDVRRALSQAMPGAVSVLAGDADAFYLAVADCALATGADSVDLPVVAFPGLRRLNVLARRRGAEALLVAGDTFRASLDATGRVQQLIAPRAGQTIRRVSESAVAALRFTSPDYSAPPGAPYRAEEVRFEVEPAVALTGTLTLPAEAAGTRVPALVTISGSGPQDRDSYAAVAGGWRPFRQIADTLSRRGWAVLRFDDRGTGASTGNYGEGTERTAAADALAAVSYLRGRPDILPDRIVLLGHSEGVRIAMLAAAADHRLAGLVLLSGAADPRAAMRAQALWLAEHAAPSRALPRDSLVAQIERLVDRQLDSLAVSGRREVYRWDAAAVAAETRVRDVAIMHGENDRQVPSDQAEALAVVFRGAGVARVTVRVFPGLNHLLVPDATGDFTRYDLLPHARVDPAVLGALAEMLGGWRRAP